MQYLGRPGLWIKLQGFRNQACGKSAFESNLNIDVYDSKGISNGDTIKISFPLEKLIIFKK